MISKFFQIGEADLLLVNSRISEELAKDEKYIIQANKLKNCSQTWNTFMCDCKFVKFKKRCYYKVCPKCGKIRVMDLFDKFIGVFKTEINALIDAPIAELETINKDVALYVQHFRDGKIQYVPGGAGIYGKLVKPGEQPKIEMFDDKQKTLSEF